MYHIVGKRSFARMELAGMSKAAAGLHESYPWTTVSVRFQVSLAQLLQNNDTVS